MWREKWGERLDQLWEGSPEKYEGERKGLEERMKKLEKDKDDRWELYSHLQKKLAEEKGNEQIA